MIHFLLWAAALVAVAILLLRRWFEPAVPNIVPLPDLPLAADPKLVAKQPRDRKRRVAVIGGSGNIGYVVADQLAQDTYYDEVVIIDVRPPGQGLPDPAKTKVSFLKCDITNTDAVVQALEGITHVVQTAALIELRDMPINQYKCWAVNVKGTWNCLNAAILNGIKSYVYTSSAIIAQTAFKSTDVCQDEAEMLRRLDSPYPNDAYRHTKCAGTRMVLAANGRAGLCVSLVSFYLNYSPFDRLVTESVRNGQYLFGHNDYGDISITSALSIAEVHTMALKGLDQKPEQVAGQLFNVVDLTLPYKEFYTIMSRKFGKGEIPEKHGVWNAAVHICGFLNWLTHGTLTSQLVANMGPGADLQSRRSVVFGPSKKAEQVFGFKPRSLEEGLKWLVEACAKYDDKLKRK